MSTSAPRADPRNEDTVDLHRLVEEQAALRRMATLVASGASPREVFEAVSAEVAALISADGSALTRYESDGTVTAVSGWTTEGGYRYVGRRYELEGTVSGLIFETGRPGRVENYDEAPGDAPEAAREMGWHSGVGAPITVEGRLWGVLAVTSRSETPLPPNTERRLAEFTELVATAIANSQAHEELAQLADEQTALRRVAMLVAEGATPDRVFDAVRNEVAQMFNAPLSVLMRYDDATNTATLLATDDGYLGPIGRSWSVESDDSAIARACRTGLPARSDYSRPLHGPMPDAARGVGARSAVAVPVVVDGSLWGVMAVGSREIEPLPADFEGRLAKFTELLATAIANAEGRAELTQLAEAQAALRRVATMVARGLPPADVFEAVSAEVGRLIPADAAGLARYETDGSATLLGGWARTGDFGLPVGERFSVDQGTGARAVFETSRSARIDSYAGVSAKIADRVRAAGWRSTVATPIIVEGGLWGFVTVASTSERLLPADTEERLAGFTDLVATAIANAEGREELHARSEEQAALRRVATLVARGVPAAEILDAVAAEVVQLLGADWAAVHRAESDGALTVASSYGKLKEEVPVGARVMCDSESLVGSVVGKGSSARLDYEGARGEWAAHARELGVRASVGAPITVEGRLWGVMIAAWTQEGRAPFMDAEARMANFTELVGTAIANAESRAELDTSRARIVATADATRRRIERDLHDGAQQQLVSLALEVRAAQANAPKELSKHREDLSHIAEGLTTVLDGLREFAHGIHPAILAEGGLGPAVKTLAHRSPIPVELDVRNDGRLAEPVEVAAYYVVSEALTNAAKHSGASKVEVDMGVHQHTLRVTVRDDGVGGADPARGSGLLGLKDRAEAIGGTLALESRRNVGTSLVALLPLDSSTS